MSNEKARLQANGEVDYHLVMDSLVSKIKGCGGMTTGVAFGVGRKLVGAIA
jgi:hypothetical protein